MSVYDNKLTHKYGQSLAGLLFDLMMISMTNLLLHTHLITLSTFVEIE